MAPASTPVALSITFGVLAIAAVTARFTARLKRRLTLRADDWTIVPALVACTANAIIMLTGAFIADLGKGMKLDAHGLPIFTPEYHTFKKCVYAAQILTTIAIAFARVSILLLYYRIFNVTSKIFRVWIWVMFILNGIWGIASTFVYIFACNPIHSFWTAARGQPGRHCIPLAFHEIYAVSSVVIDILMLVIPWPQILSMLMSRREKATVLGIFGLGTLVIGAAIAKTEQFFEAAQIMMGGRHSRMDEAIGLYCGTVESCLAVVCACLPTLRPLLDGVSLQPVVDSFKSLLRPSTSDLSVGKKETQARPSTAATDKDTYRHDCEVVENGPPPVPYLPPYAERQSDLREQRSKETFEGF